jgi:hypothetical protein
MNENYKKQAYHSRVIATGKTNTPLFGISMPEEVYKKTKGINLFWDIRGNEFILRSGCSL